MRGVSVPEIPLGLNGFYGDRRYAVVRRSLAATDGFPWLTGRQYPGLLLFIPLFRRSPSWENSEPPVAVRTPDGVELDVDDPALVRRLEAECGLDLFLLKSLRGNYDSEHVSLFSLNTVRYLAAEIGRPLDYRQFRANLYVEPSDATPFAEESWVGHIVRIGAEAIIGITQTDTRCMMINLDPETAVQQSEVLRTVTRNHAEQAGLYANVIAAGTVRIGDSIRLLDANREPR